MYHQVTDISERDKKIRLAKTKKDKINVFLEYEDRMNGVQNVSEAKKTKEAKRSKNARKAKKKD